MREKSHITPYVTIIGAANMDITAKSDAAIIHQDSNPSTIRHSHGGVGRNIAENLARLGAQVKLMAPLGMDAFGKELLAGCQAVGINMDCCYVSESISTPCYLAVLDNQGEMYVGAVDMSCTLPVSHILNYGDAIRGSQILFVDTNLEQEVIEFILKKFGDKDLYVDPISVTKAKKIKHLLGRFHTIKMNRLEAEAFTDMAIGDEANEAGLRSTGDFFLRQGTKRIIISLGEKGLYYRTKEVEIRLLANRLTPKNATGAGDALMAGIAYCSLHGKDDDYTARFAKAMAEVALLSEDTVSAQMSVEEIIGRFY